MTIYAVSRGEYSDFCIMGLFSTKEKAEEAIRKSKESKYENLNDTTEEYELDEMVEFQVGPRWTTGIRIDDGTSTSAYPLGNAIRHPERCVIEANDHHISVESPISPEHAAKVASEERQKRLRERAV